MKSLGTINFFKYIYLSINKVLQKYESIKTESQLLCMHVSKFTNRPENFEIELYMFLQKQIKSDN